MATVLIGLGHAGGLRREVWHDVKGAGVWKLSEARLFADVPDLIETIPDAQAPVNYDDEYGQRLRGYLIPTVSGTYRFWITSDDNSELLLSPDDNKFSRKWIAGIRGRGIGSKDDYAQPDQWDKFATQQSEEIDLVAGQRYFIEILHKDHKGDDHLSVGWTGPGMETPTVIKGEFLEAYDLDRFDQDSDELPDSWEETFGLNTSDNGEWRSENGPLGDPDNDGWPNWQECINGSDPTQKELVQGKLEQSFWFNVPGRSAFLFSTHSRFHQVPHHRCLHGGCSVTELPGANHFGMRLRGYLSVPETGTYHLYISGNDSCELLISESESRFSLDRIAWVGGGLFSKEKTKAKEWGKYPGQKSPPLQLEAGKRYYIESVHKGTWKKSHLSLGWSTPDSDEVREIPESAICSYMIGEEDPDDDGLPTEWEEAHGLDPNSRTGSDGPLGDQDEDLIPNWLEYDCGTDPNSYNNLPGGFAEEIWRDIQGNRVRDLTGSVQFLAGADYKGLRLGNFSLADRGNHYGIRLKGTITAPVSGRYTFWVSSDNHSELWLSETDRKFEKNLIAWLEGPGVGTAGDYVGRRAWDRYPSQKSKTIFLNEGQTYYLEALLKQGVEANHIDVAWQIPGKKRQLIPPSVLTSAMKDIDDADDDYLPDEWEAEVGLSPEDNGQSFGDKEGEHGDFDGDGLTNWTEYRLGTDPTKVDTDGDGVNDDVEINDYRSDPLVRDVYPPSVFHRFDHLNPSRTVGEWEVDNRGLLSTERRGELAYQFILDEAGIYFAELMVEVVSEERHVMPIRFLVDDQEVARRDIEGSSRQVKTVSERLPWLSTGEHTLTIDSDNVWSGAQLRVISLRLMKAEGADINSNGTADWLEGVLDREHSANVPTTSFVSPVCLEGTAVWSPNVKIWNSRRESEALKALGSGWYSDFPLNRSQQTPINISFEGGLIEQDFQIDWLETNVATHAGEVVLRKGDSLKLVAFEGQTPSETKRVTFFANEESIHRGGQDEPFVYRFREAGQVTITAKVNGQLIPASLVVTVMGGSFRDPLHVVGGTHREWELPRIPYELELEADEQLSFTEAETSPEEVRIVNVGFSQLRQSEHHVIARLPGQGTIVARGTVKSFILAKATTAGDHEVVDILDDGSRVIEAGYVLDGSLPPNFSIFLSMWVADAVFEDGQSTRILTADDFDENGLAKVSIIKAPGEDDHAICHIVEAYQGRQRIAD